MTTRQDKRAIGRITNRQHGEWLALLSLTGMVVAVFWRLALTDLIIGRGDLFFYFYPYRDYASEAARAGRVPLWNPYLFMGVPFLANSQAGFFYPLNLALAWLPVLRMVNASIVLHAALAASGAYLWGRGGLGLRRSGAWLSGLCYGLGGYLVAQVEHLNQVQVLAWLPWLFWLFSWRAYGRKSTGSKTSSHRLRIAGLATVIAVQFLAGHTQSVFISLIGLTGYAVLPELWATIRSGGGWRQVFQATGHVSAATLLGGALAAVQLLPTFELSRLSVRSGGLPYKEAVSFSLRPELLGRALLPAWGGPLFPEFVAYVGVVGLGLAAVGVLGIWRGPRFHAQAHAAMPWQSAQRGALVLAGLGLFLALGGYNPVYFLLVKLVPGFGLFRAPARWLALYAVGVSGVAGIGLDGLVALRRPSDIRPTPRRTDGSWRKGWLIGGGVIAGLVLIGLVLNGYTEPDLSPPLGVGSVIGWLAAALAFGVALTVGPSLHKSSSSRGLATLLIPLVAIELVGASLFLPINRATAPGALTDVRPAVAHLLAEANTAQAIAPARFLSISDIFFDPGDKKEIEIALQPQLSSDAVYDYIIATKQKEVLIPNLPLYYRLPTVDGYDGGVLPLRRYVTLENLYMPEEQVAIDGRLRENLEIVPDGRWLSLFNVQFVITDKVGDAWFDDVFYDLQMGATLGLGDEATMGDLPGAAATGLAVVYRADGAAVGTALAEVDLTFADGEAVTLTLVADTPNTGDQVARLGWGKVAVPSALRMLGVWQQGQARIRGLSLVDERIGAFWPLVISDSGRYRLVHSGDVKIYENLEVLPRLVFVPHATIVPDDDAALTLMRDTEFDPASTVVIAGSSHRKQALTAAPRAPGAAQHASTEMLLYRPERIVTTVTAPTDGWLLLTDAWYPGWEASVDGDPVAIERADILFRAVAVSAGEHRVEWVFRPTSFRLGSVISLGAIAVLLVVGVWELAARSSGDGA